MTTEVARLRDQLRRAILGGAWHGPSVAEALARHRPETAWRRLPENGHNAAEIAIHIAVWLDVVRRRVSGEAVTPSPADDWPDAPRQGQEGWDAVVARVMAAYEALDRDIQGLDDDRLEAPGAGVQETAYVLLHGAIQHAIYHAGQLVLMSRIVGATPR